ncbi:MAG: hypothetical protein IT292_08920 [Deltaproteobacteria bacterium]|nr:hypothetical protein [Deltaproteobacteria bacterium]
MVESPEEIVAMLIALLQGYVSIPEYRLLYVFGCYVAHRWTPERKRELNPISTLNVFLEASALLITSLSLLVPYLLYFNYLDAPQGVNAIWFWSFAVGFLLFRLRQEVRFMRDRKKQPIYVDLENKDDRGRYLLTSFWTYRDLEKYLVQLEQGKNINVYGYQKTTDSKRQRKITGKGTVYFDGKDGRWVSTIEWHK